MLLRPRPVAVALLTLGLAHPAGAQPEAVEPRVALPILLKVLTYDRALATRPPGDFTVLIVAEPGQEAARDQVMATVDSLKLASLQGRVLRFRSWSPREGALEAKLRQEQASAVLELPGTSAATAQSVAKAVRTAQLYGLSLDPGLVDQKLAMLGVSVKDGRPQIVLCPDAARANGAIFESSILRLARVVN